VSKTISSEKRHLAELSETERAEAMQRYRIIQPYLDGETPLPKLLQSQPNAPSLATARRWVKAYREDGLVGLARQARQDRGSHRVADRLQEVIEALVLQSKYLSVSAIHRKVGKLAAEQGWDVPSYQTVWRIIQELDPALKTLAHSGGKAYDQAYDLLYQRQSSRPNQIWQADHSQLNIYLLNNEGQVQKPNLTIILDDYSRAVSAYFLSFDAPSALHTSLTLRQGIWRKEDPRWQVCGIPEIFYSDHGSDFTSLHMEEVCINLHIQIIHSIVGKPRGRGRIERFFESIEQLWLYDLPGYAPENRPLSKPSLRLEEFDDLFREFLLENYQQRIHGTTGQAPQIMWTSQAFLPQMPESLEELDLLLLNLSQSRQVRREGIRFNNYWYTDPVLSAYVHEEVTIRYDPRDMAEIRVYHENHFLCRAICYELAGDRISLKEIQTARRQRKRVLQDTLRQRKAVLKQFTEKADSPEFEESAATPKVESSKTARPKLKRYFNE